MNNSKNKATAIAIAILLTITLGTSTLLISNVNAHSPPWQIPTYAYIIAAPAPVGVGQTVHVYMWLDPVYGAAGGTVAAIGSNGSTASAALLSNSYRFKNYQLTITAPDGTVTTQTFATISDPTSNQAIIFTPTQVGTYNFTFNYQGQVYGANGNGYEGSSLYGDYYLPSNASTTLIVQQTPIPPPTGSSPLPSAYWESPVYGENTDWYTITSNWLGQGLAPPQNYGGTYFSTLYHSDAVGPQTSHIMWTSQLDFGGVAGGNSYTTGGSDPNVPTGVQYWEGSSYQPRFVNPILVSGYLYYTEPISFSGGTSGPTVCVNLVNGQVLWSRSDVPQLLFAYVYNLWDPDQHGVYPPILVAQNPILGSSSTGQGYQWQFYDGFTGDSLFNATNIPTSSFYTTISGTAVVNWPNQIVTSPSIMGPGGEALRYVITNIGTASKPNWYMSEWNMSKLWQYDVNPYTGGGSLSPAVINASNGWLIGGPVVGGSVTTLQGDGGLPPPNTGVLQPGISPVGQNLLGLGPYGPPQVIPAGSTILVNANIGINSNALAPGSTQTVAQINQGSLATYDWNISLPWLNTMPPEPAVIDPTTGLLDQPLNGTNPITAIVAVNYDNIMLCRNGSLPQGFAATNKGYPQLPFTYFAVDINTTHSTFGQILWSQTYNPPAGNLSLVQEPVDFQTGVFTFNYQETRQFVGYSLTNGNYLWTTPSQGAWDYYGYPGTVQLPGTTAYGNLYDSSFGGVCYAYNDLTGQLLWTWGNGPPGSDNSTNSGLNVFYGDYPTMIQAIGNGIIYLATNEHTVPNPIYKGAVMTELNATTGQLITQLSDYPSEWSLPGTEFAIGNGYATFMNGYNNQIYSVGRGPSATTVQAPQIASSVGEPVVIQGTVTDISAGTKQSQQASDFPSGVPVSSDASMGAWMGYIYQQQPLPTNFIGVPVSIDALDPNNNYVHLGDTTTNAQGFFHYSWTPPNVPGDYTVYATFAGTNGYWPSNAVTAMTVVGAHPTAAPTPQPPASMTDTYVIGGVIAIIIVIAIVGALILMAVRKRP